MKTKFFTLLLNKSLLSKLALIALLLTGGGNCALGDEVYFDSETSQTITGWTTSGTSQRTYGAPYYIYKNGTGATITSNNSILFTSYNKLVINSKYYSATGNKIEVKYSDDNGESWTTYTTITDIPATNTDFEIIGLEGSYKIQLVLDHVYLYALTLVDINPYPAPKNLSVDGISSTSSTLGWTVGKDETAWQIAYSTKENFNPDNEGVKVDVTENPYTLTGLIDGVTYYAYIRSNYSGNYSAWSNKISLIPMTSITCNDFADTNTNVVIPTNASYESQSQFIIPSSELAVFSGRIISQIVLYGYGNNTSIENVSWGNTTFDVYISETETSTFSSTFFDWGTKVCSEAKLSIVDGKMVIDFDSPFYYNAGNLIIGIQKGSTGSAVSCGWYGVNTDNKLSGYAKKSWAGGSLSFASANFSPKLTISSVGLSLPVTLGTNGYTTFACPRALDFTAANMPSGLKAYKATVDGTNVRFTEIDQTVPANTGVLLGGTPGETYQIPVAESGTAVEGNEFLVNSTGGTFAAESGYTYYALKKNSDPLTFATFNPSTLQLPTNKAYLKVADTAARSLMCWFDNETTGIFSATLNDNGESIKDNSIYNLQGQRVAQPQKGLYIVNGKKFINK